ncbi:hypothetical protein SDC9_85849 [bioreactor metagenome]|uniref:Uncharacterized protein n=1 Tax=bioreactor metagenome TaxID=1076179 RepID=A0A644ZEC8_9ZZZZ
MRHVPLYFLLAVLAGGVAVAPLHIGDDAFKRRVKRAAAEFLAVGDMQLVLAGAVKNGVLYFLRQILERRFHGSAVVRGQRLEIHARYRALRAAVPAHHVDASLRQRKRPIGDYEVGVDFEQRTETRAGRARAKGVVEGEHAGRKLFYARSAVRAGVVLRKKQLLAVHNCNNGKAVAEAERGFQRIREPAFDALLDHNAVDHRVDIVLKLFIQRGNVRQIVHGSVHADAHIPFPLELVEQFLMLALPPANARRDNLRLRAFRQVEHAVDHLVDGLALDHLSAVRAVRNAAARVKKAEVVVNLRYGAHGAARVMARALLVDGDRGGKPVDAVDIRLLHLTQKLARIGR